MSEILLSWDLNQSFINIVTPLLIGFGVGWGWGWFGVCVGFGLGLCWVWVGFVLGLGFVAEGVKFGCVWLYTAKACAGYTIHFVTRSVNDIHHVVGFVQVNCYYVDIV